MSLPSPNLDDRTFDQLVEDAMARVKQSRPAQSRPAWNDLSPGDPGRVLLELFAHLTETMIYRLNRLPEKAYYEFLNLMGVRLYPPTAARAMLEFRRSGDGQGPIDIPEGTRVTVGRSEGAGEAPEFITADDVTLPAGNEPVRVAAYHCEWVAGEWLGQGTDLAGLTVQLSRPPVIAPTADPPDLVVGVEAGPGEPGEKREYEGKVYRIWKKVPSFAGYRRDDCVYVADRYSGQIAFAPEARMTKDDKLAEEPDALAEIPLAGREIRAWYRRGGGPDGNVAAGELTVLRDPIPGLKVTNPAWAVGGRAEESLENALVRGPQEMHCQERAVTKRDFERLAKRALGEVARARAVTQRKLWEHGQEGTVEVLLVPDVPAKEWGSKDQVTVEAIKKHRDEAVLKQVQDYLDARRPLGVRCEVKWAQLKTVTVRAELGVHREASAQEVKERVEKRLYSLINPLPTSDSTSGWSFGQTLYSSVVYRAALDEPEVLEVHAVGLKVESAPDRNVTALAADHFQKDTWYAARGDRLFRSQNDGEGWEPLRRFENDIVLVRAYRWQPGLVAAVAGEDEVYRVHVSRDCGEVWEEPAVEMPADCRVHGIDWTMREKEPWLLLATDKGLYELALASGSVPEKVAFDPANEELGFYAVAVAYDDAGSEQSVAVAARKNGGVYLSRETGQFDPIGLTGEDIRVLAVQHHKGHTFLWAGRYAEGPKDEEDGCWRLELDFRAGWEHWGRDKGWQGGSCRALASLDGRVYAATHHAGVLYLHVDALGDEKSAAGESTDEESTAEKVKWQAPFAWPKWRKAADGIPALEIGRSVAALGETVLAGTDKGVLRSQDGGKTYQDASAQGVLRSQDGDKTNQDASAQASTDKVTLPPTWLFCSGKHEITVEVKGEQDESK